MNSKKLTISGIVEQKINKLFNRPKELFVRGNIEIEALLSRPCVGVVGTRLPTAYGRAVTEDLVTELTRRGVVIISGLALGTDGLAHQFCLKAGGQTIAVLPCGIDTVYPKSNLAIARQIAESSGVLISEYSGTGLPRADQFIARNRIIAALSDVLVIPEAADRSGSLHTANFALEMNIPVMAVPGNITSRFSGGTNKLIAQGATPILSASDILRELKIDTEVASQYIPESEAESKLLEAMRSGIQDGALLREVSQLEPQIYMQTLTLLEIKGIIKPLGSDQWRQI